MSHTSMPATCSGVSLTGIDRGQERGLNTAIAWCSPVVMFRARASIARARTAVAVSTAAVIQPFFKIQKGASPPA
jgi:hypothetical protein